jgi:epoxide hydrolase-like predicted phosphatase
VSVRAVISDFGGVLTSPLIEAFAVVQERSGLPMDALGRAMASVGAARGENPLYELERGEMTEREFLSLLEDALRTDLGREVSLHDFADVWWGALSPNVELFDFYRSLRAAGLRMVMLTNNVREWEPRWRAMLPIDEVFHGVVDSAFVGVRKPDPRIYELALREAGVVPDEAVFVDDIDVNVEAARALGMPSVHFAQTGEAIAEIASIIRPHARA